MKIVLTGATGFIGKAILAEIAEPGREVFALVRDPARLRRATEGLPPANAATIVPIVGDLTLPRLGISPVDAERIADADVIIHAGGPMNIQLSESEAERVFLEPAKELAELAERIHEKKGLKHFIHLVGFMSPYHEGNFLTNQDDSLRHAPPYERAKFQADGYLRQALHRSAIPLSTVNPSVVIGDSATGRTEQLGGLGILVDAVRRNLMPLSPGGNRYWLPMVHLDHVASFVGKLVRTEAVVSDTYPLLDAKEESPTMHALICGIANELRTMRPVGGVPPKLLKAALRTGIGERIGIPAESMNFVVQRDFPIRPKIELERKFGEPTSLERSTLPFVIADLDYRLSHGERPSPAASLVPKRRSKVVTLERQGEGPPIMLLHGAFSGADRFAPVAERLDGLNTILVDLPGFGRSPVAKGSDFLEDCVEAVTELIHGLGEPVVLGGHSFGGWVAARVMERVESRIRLLALMQPVLRPVSRKFRYAAVTRALLKGMSGPAFGKELRKGGDFPEGGASMERYVAETMRDLRSPRIRDSNARAMSLLAQASSFEIHPDRWKRDKVRILYGERDRAFGLPEPFRRFRADALPYGHQFPIEAPTATAEWLRDLAGSEPSTTNGMFLPRGE